VEITPGMDPNLRPSRWVRIHRLVRDL